MARKQKYFWALFVDGEIWPRYTHYTKWEATEDARSSMSHFPHLKWKIRKVKITVVKP